MTLSILENNEEFLDLYQSDLQSNIFSPHRQDHTLLLFINFSEARKDLEMMVAILRSFGTNSLERQGLHLTTSWEVRFLDNQSANEKRRALYFNVYLSKHGLEALGYQKNGWEAILQNLEQEQDIMEENPFRDNEIVHAVFSLAHAQQDRLDNEKERVKNLLDIANAKILHEENGAVYRKKYYASQTKGFTVEHFGYADGISNPWITSADTIVKGEPKTRRYWDNIAATSQFLVEEPTNYFRKRYGSFLAFRKYEQQVDKFMEQRKELADLSQLEEADAAALIIGRKRSGDPIETPEKEPIHSINDFRYSTGRCPMFSHIRKLNPRNEPANELRKVLKMPILRRGVTYGKRAVINEYYNRELLVDELPTEPVGLLFMSFQNDMNKFQQLLAQSKYGKEDIDPILGSLRSDMEKMIHHIPDAKNPNEFFKYKGLNGLITFRGGLNLYAPSVYFFRKLQLPEVVA